MERVYNKGVFLPKGLAEESVEIARSRELEFSAHFTNSYVSRTKGKNLSNFKELVRARVRSLTESEIIEVEYERGITKFLARVTIDKTDICVPIKCWG